MRHFFERTNLVALNTLFSHAAGPTWFNTRGQSARVDYILTCPTAAATTRAINAQQRLGLRLQLPHAIKLADHCPVSWSFMHPCFHPGSQAHLAWLRPFVDTLCSTPQLASRFVQTLDDWAQSAETQAAAEAAETENNVVSQTLACRWELRGQLAELAQNPAQNLTVIRRIQHRPRTLGNQLRHTRQRGWLDRQTRLAADLEKPMPSQDSGAKRGDCSAHQVLQSELEDVGAFLRLRQLALVPGSATLQAKVGTTDYHVPLTWAVSLGCPGPKRNSKPDTRVFRQGDAPAAQQFARSFDKQVHSWNRELFNVLDSPSTSEFVLPVEPGDPCLPNCAQFLAFSVKQLPRFVSDCDGNFRVPRHLFNYTSGSAAMQAWVKPCDETSRGLTKAQGKGKGNDKNDAKRQRHEEGPRSGQRTVASLQHTHRLSPTLTNFLVGRPSNLETWLVKVGRPSNLETWLVEFGRPSNLGAWLSSFVWAGANARLHEFKAQELSALLWGFSAAGFYNGAVFSAAAVTLQRLDMTPQHLVNSLWALTRKKPRQLAMHALTLVPACTMMIERFSTVEIVAIASASAKAVRFCDGKGGGRRPSMASDFCAAANSQVLHRLKDLTPSVLVGLAAAFLVVRYSGAVVMLAAVGREALDRLQVLETSLLLALIRLFVVDLSCLQPPALLE
ncbi:unnamed protein product, partial [Polarella glacialis]